MLMPTDLETLFNERLYHMSEDYQEVLEVLAIDNVRAIEEVKENPYRYLLEISMDEYEDDLPFVGAQQALNMSEQEWRPYWERLVEVCAMIEVHRNQFDMRAFHSNHNYNYCGTTHCIAGWAEVMYDTSSDWKAKTPVGHSLSTPNVAMKHLSVLLDPFFYLIQGDPAYVNKTVYNEFIQVVLNEARRDGFIPNLQTYDNRVNRNALCAT
jgi:hypothetical protein